MVAGRVNEPLGGLNYACQPSITADGKTLVFVRSDGNWEGDDLYLAIRVDTTAPFDSVRPLEEINVGGRADAYPCISPDGLRLYYARDTSLWVTIRDSVQEAFGAPYPLPIHGSSEGLFSAWLTDSELELYGTNGSTVFYASRTSRDDSFSVLVQHPEFSGLGFVSGPSMFGERLYLYNSGRILIFAPASGGVEERQSVTARMQPAGPSFLRSILFMPQSILFNPRSHAALLDISARKVLDLHPGPNDVSGLRAGVYFVRTETPNYTESRKLILAE